MNDEIEIVADPVQPILIAQHHPPDVGLVQRAEKTADERDVPVDGAPVRALVGRLIHN
jgi:hypothetical protein